MKQPAKARTGRNVNAATAATALACATAGLATLLVLSGPLLFGDRYCGLDLTRVDLGVICALKQLLATGSSLEMGRHLGGGSPLLARPTAQLLYPLRWLVLPMGPDLAASMQVILHLALGAAASTWLARTLHVRPLAAACTGLVFAFSGTALNLMFHSIYVVAVAWLPLCWAATRRALHPRRNRVALPLLAVGVAGLALGGEPQALAIAGGLALMEAIRTGLRAWRRNGLRIGRTLAVLIASAAASAIP